MEQKKRSVKFWLIVSVVLMIISMIGASRVQTLGGDVVIKDMRWETETGKLMSAYLLIPPNATEDNPAPGIVTSHGWYNTREMQDLNYIEYARRGYVVISIDMYGHGNTQAFEGGIEGHVGDFVPQDWDKNGTGMYDAVKLMATLPYVDKSKIGITGHSNGARACNLSIEDDNKLDIPLVAAVLLVANDAVYRNPETNGYWNMYGNRDTGIIAALYDEFFFRRDFADGTTSVPRTYMGTMDAQSFLHFGADPYASSLDKRDEGTFYTENINGKESVRVIWQPDQIHPWNHFSKECVIAGVEFFDRALGAPNQIPPSNQIWQIKVVFNTLGLIGFVMFFVSFAQIMLWTPFFSSLRAQEIVKAAPAPSGSEKIWFFGSLIIGNIVSMLVYFPSLNVAATSKPAFFHQIPPFGIGLWAAICGISTVILLTISYNVFGRKKGMDLEKAGVKMPWGKFGKTVLLALIVVAVTYLWVFISQYFFTVDFRIWSLAIKAFTPDKLIVALPYFVLFLTYYVANSVSVNAFSYNGIGRKEWVNTAILGAFNSLAPVIMVAVQYGYFFSTGELYYTPARGAILGSLGGIWLIPVIVILFVAAVISRKIYRVSGNPYLAGIMNGVLVTVISCTNTLTILP